ncbi:MAG: TerC family protein [Bacteroidales bacterium]|nr:TerC family protein [Bacteroidales bacterium]
MRIMELFYQPGSWIALITLILLEVVLGIDNVIFISIITNRLPAERQRLARNLGLLLAMIFRSLLLLTISFFIRFTNPLFAVFQLEISTRDLILLAGGMFLIIKSVSEIHQKMEGADNEVKIKVKTHLFTVIFQIVLLDLIFSFDSILTAIGLTDKLPLMITAIIVAILIMMLFAGSVSRFINKHPTLQVLALSFLILIGFMLVLDGLHKHVPKGYIYFAVFFSLVVEIINIRIRRISKPVDLHHKFPEK